MASDNMFIPQNLKFLFGSLLCFFAFVSAGWLPNAFPNPTTGGFQKCNMNSTANICDPDGMLAESERYRLDHALNQLETRTRQDHAPDFCQKKGVTGAMAIAKHFTGDSEVAVKTAANEMLKTWDLDRQCQKSIIIVMATEDRKFWVARGDSVPVYANEFTAILDAQKQYFKNGNYSAGMQNIVQNTWKTILLKQARVTPLESEMTPPPQPTPDTEGDSSFPWTFLIIIIFVVSPICCCVLQSFCFFCTWPCFRYFRSANNVESGSGYHSGKITEQSVQVDDTSHAGKGLYSAVPRKDDGGGDGC